MTTLQLFDTPRSEIVPFEPNEHVLMYTCGITPYDATHLGHAATFISYDLLQRHLIDKGHTIQCVRNVTDVDGPCSPKPESLGVHISIRPPPRKPASSATWWPSTPCPSPPRPEPHRRFPTSGASSGWCSIRRGYAYQAGRFGLFRRSKSDTFGAVTHYSEAEIIEFAKHRGAMSTTPTSATRSTSCWAPIGSRRTVVGHDVGVRPPGCWHIERSALACGSRYDDRSARWWR